MSIWPPRACSAASTSGSIDASLPRSAAMAKASTPFSFSTATASSRSACLREVTTTLAPASPSDSAICRPRPREPPVTRAVWPSRLKSCWMGVLMKSPCSEPVVVHFAADGFAVAHGLQPALDQRQLVGEEVAAGGLRALSTRSVGLPGGQGDIQPHPGDHDMAEGL